MANAPDQLWVADMTYIPTWAGFVYLAMVLDACSRKVVGWAMGEEMTAELVVSALNMALATRKPDSVIHHSDQGSQYTSLAFGSRCKEMGVGPRWARWAMPTTTPWPRASSPRLECELIARRTWKSKAEAKTAVFTWIEGWYNPRRRHSALDHQSPMNFERKHNAARTCHATTAPRTRVAHRVGRFVASADRRRGQPCGAINQRLRIKPTTVRGNGASPECKEARPAGTRDTLRECTGHGASVRGHVARTKAHNGQS